jgi:putative ABC transport system permease protein
MGLRMSFASAIRVALAALLVHKTRSVLTSLGIIIGTSAVIAMVSAGEGARRKLDARLDRVGKNLILIKAGSSTEPDRSAAYAPLTRGDATAIRKEVGPLLVGVAESQLTQRLAISAGAAWLTTIVGCTPELQPVRSWQLTGGRFITDEDLKKTAPICVLGHTVRLRLFPNNPNPIGERVRLDRLQLRVVGVTAEKGRSPTGADQDDQIFLPLTTLQRKLVGEEKILLIVSAARSEETVEKAKEAIIRVLRRQRHIKDGASDDFDVSTVQEMAQLAVVLTGTMRLLVAVIASISLVVGGIGIMNIMLVSVTERTQEIGLRMAVGATAADVLTQFLIEAVVLALAGGVVGVSLGIAGAAGVARLAHWPIVINPAIVGLAFAAAAGVGIFFGYYPALKASNLEPAVALRQE